MMLANILGPDALIILVLALVVIFGAGRLPKLARNIGEASKEFKKAQDEKEAEAAAAQQAAEAARQAAVPPAPTPLPPAAPTSPDDKITLSKGELDALLAEREARARREAESPPNN
jgi:sec-independent protein translocase protein TatA